METPRQSKNHLSKHLLQMKFMQRSALRVQKEDYEADQKKFVDDEHWRLDIPELAQKESKYVMEPSFAYCENLRFGRISFKGFNPEIEKLMLSQDGESELAQAAEREKEISVADDEMAKRYSTLVGTMGKKFAKKRHRGDLEDDPSDGEVEVIDIVDSPSPSSRKTVRRENGARGGNVGQYEARGGKVGKDRGGPKGKQKGGRYYKT